MTWLKQHGILFTLFNLIRHCNKAKEMIEMELKDMKELYREANLTNEEITGLALRGLFESNGYHKYRLNKFEEYSLYAENKDFIAGDRVLTFTDLDGRLMALKPDVTLSIIKSLKNEDLQTRKIYYSENVYRESKEGNSYDEISQMGLEYLGSVKSEEIQQVTSLAQKALALIDSDYRLVLSHMSFVEGILDSMKVDGAVYAHVLKLIRNKNRDGLLKVSEKYKFSREETRRLCAIPQLTGPWDWVIKEAEKWILHEGMKEGLEVLKQLCEKIVAAHPEETVLIDLSMINDIDYYNGVIFRGYVKGSSTHILAGGQYDRAMALLGKNTKGMGFAVYLNEIPQRSLDRGKDDTMITIALPKGRLGDQVDQRLKKAGYHSLNYEERNRKLIVEHPKENIRYVLVKPTDVPVYVEYGGADLGIVGKDILMETEPDVYELSDLKLGYCKMVVAAPEDFEDSGDEILRVATKYSHVAKKYYREKNREIQVIKLNGSIELGPLLNLSHVIVDLVETGKTLRENHLVVKEEIKEISARCIVNKSIYPFKKEALDRLARELSEPSDHPLMEREKKEKL